MIELNHVYSNTGSLCFSQVIIWEIDPSTRKFLVMDWQLASCIPIQYPQETRVWFKGWNLRSKIYRESFSHTDPERENIKIHPQELRKTFLVSK
jgi:hypothetical protein